MNQLRVAILTERFWPLSDEWGGFASMLAQQLRMLGALPSIITAKWERDWPEHVYHREIPVFRVDRPRGVWAAHRFWKSMTAWLERHAAQFHIILVAAGHQVAPLRGLKSLRQPLVVLARPALGKPSDPWFSDIVQADAWVVANQSLADSLKQHCDAQRVHVIAPGIPEREATTSEQRQDQRAALAAINRDLYVPPQTRVIACPAVFDVAAPLLSIIDGFHALANELGDLRLWITGDGPQRHHLFQHIKDRELYGRVLIPGTFDDLAGVMQAADICLATGLTDLPLALLQSLAHALPTIAAEQPGVTLPMEHETNGLVLTAPASQSPSAKQWSLAMRRVLEDSALANQLGLAGQSSVRQNHSSASCGQAFLTLFRQLLGDRA